MKFVTSIANGEMPSEVNLGVQASYSPSEGKSYKIFLFGCKIYVKVKH